MFIRLLLIVDSWGGLWAFVVAVSLTLLVRPSGTRLVATGPEPVLANPQDCPLGLGPRQVNGVVSGLGSLRSAASKVVFADVTQVEA